MESTGQHLLALKVMRVSRPALASAWEPFYSSSPSFSARSTASIVSLQGKDPLPGHPKTLRDLANASELLTLPSSFGAIQLGETFSSCLSVNNEAAVDVAGVFFKVEMQTATSKIPLVEISAGSDGVLKAGDAMEVVVHHEIKELGQHVLACTVAYRLPPNTRHSPSGLEGAENANSQTFHKFYKFAVTNPLSVKTKIYTPRSPSAMLSRTEREKVFLEVHIQNLTPDALWFQRIDFECAEGWSALDTLTDNSKGDEALFSDALALMQPQDTRQYIYILTPTSLPSFPVVHSPGTVIALGRLDICWRSTFGEPGRLLTSMLSRRIPVLTSATSPGGPSVITAKHPIPAIPPHMQRSSSAAGVPPRPRSPQLPIRSQTPPNASRSQSPGPVPHRPGSPFRGRNVVQPPASPPVTPIPIPQLSPTDVEVDITVNDFAHDSVCIEKPFEISFKLLVTAPVPPGKARSVLLAVQHVLPPRAAPAAYLPPSVYPVRQETLASSGRSSPSPTGSPHRGNFGFSDSLTKRLLVSTPRTMYGDEVDDEILIRDDNVIILPPPFASAEDEIKYSNKTRGVAFLGASVVLMDAIQLEGSENGQVESREFTLTYMPMRKGFSTVGGLRVLLVGDQLGNEEKPKAPTLILKEWDVIAEVWVQG